MKHVLPIGSLVGILSLVVAGSVQQTVQAQGAEKGKARDLDPVVFQAAGPNAASIQSMVDAFRAEIGGANNGNIAGPIAEGRRINWDGGGSTATSIVPTPFDGFLLTRGGRFTTRGDGFIQAPVEGLAATFNNPSSTTEFKAFSPVRLFSPLDSNVTTARFFVPGGGEVPRRPRRLASSSPRSISRAANGVTAPRPKCCSTGVRPSPLPGGSARVGRRGELFLRWGAVRRGTRRVRPHPHRQCPPGSRRQQAA